MANINERIVTGDPVSTNASVGTPLTVAETVIVGPKLSDFFSLVITPCTVVVHIYIWQKFQGETFTFTRLKPFARKRFLCLHC